jgi:glutathione S-transferase
MLTIWGRLNSHNVKKVAWLAGEIGIDHVRHDIGGQFGYTDAYLAMNPNRLVPTIEDDGFVLWESNAILRYLAAKHGGALWPADPTARAIGEKWMDWHFAYAEAQRPAFVNLVRTAPERRDHDAIARSAETCGTLMAILDAALGQSPWLSGAAFGLGDVPMGVYAHTYFALDIPRPALPNVARWYAGLQERPSYASQVMIPLT